jgi:hypothetical protein
MAQNSRAAEAPAPTSPPTDTAAPGQVGFARQVASKALSLEPARLGALWTSRRPRALRWDAISVSHALTLVELVIIVLWAGSVTRPYLDMDPATVPLGREYLSITAPHHFWTRLQECGMCALWNGSLQGGVPAVPDPFASTLHPLVMIGVLGWGVTVGSKLALAGGFLMAGLAQWWLGRVLGLGRIACVWSACLAIAGGHLAGRMEMGALVGVISTAACALALPPLILLARTASRRTAVLLGTTFALIAVAGQGYMQAGFALTFPAALLLLPRNRERALLVLQRFAQAVAVGALIAAPFLIAFFHFLPALQKELDPTFNAFQPFNYIWLNLVIGDLRFHTTDSLIKVPYASHNVLFVGWLAVLLAIWGVHKGLARQDRAPILYLIALTILAFWIGSGGPLKWIGQNVPNQTIAEQFMRLRYGTLIAGLAVAPVLALAAVGLDSLLRTVWPHVRFVFTSRAYASLRLPVVVDARWLLVVPLLLALGDARAFTTNWIGTVRASPELERALAAMRTPDLQWVDAPFGEHPWIEPAAAAHLKLASGVQAWRLAGRQFPEPYLAASRTGPPAGMSPIPVQVVDGLPIYIAPPGREYAAVLDGASTRTVCTAQGLGGQVDVVCDVPQPGTVTVLENNWSGWQASVDGQGTGVKAGRWLSLDVPAGRHQIQLRYRPWDVLLGLLLSAGGIALAIYLWRRDTRGTDGPQYEPQ